MDVLSEKRNPLKNTVVNNGHTQTTFNSLRLSVTTLLRRNVSPKLL